MGAGVVPMLSPGAPAGAPVTVAGVKGAAAAGTAAFFPLALPIEVRVVADRATVPPLPTREADTRLRVRPRVAGSPAPESPGGGGGSLMVDGQ